MSGFGGVLCSDGARGDLWDMPIDPVWLQQQFPKITGLRAIGLGGQKSVYEGHHPTNGDIVLKLFHLFTEIERVQREIEAVRKIHSPRIPHIFATGKLQSPMGEVFWVREQRIFGKSLRDFIKQGPLPHHDVLRLALHLLEVLAAAEVANIVHRDVKPENVLISPNGDAWLLDFGLARHLDLESLTATALRRGPGTLGYSPIEQLVNRKPDIDSRADLFALGVTLYECVEGVNPLIAGARDESDIIKRTESTVLLRITQPIDAKSEFNELVAMMTQRRRNYRIKTVAEALEWMREICDAEGIIW